MIVIKKSKWKGHDTIELHRNGRFVLAFGKTKAQAIIEAIRDKEALKTLEEFSGHAQADRDSATHAAEAADRDKYNEAWKEQIQ